MEHLYGQRPTTRINVVLVKPSKYDDDGYIVRYRRGFLPSNTLACLCALTEDVRRRGVLGKDLRWDVEVLDDTVQEIPVDKISRKAQRRGSKTVVCLVGVQTNQFPRAADLAMAFRARGVEVMIGGFHVSGSMAMISPTPPEIESLMAAGVTVVLGEVEGRWEGMLRDVLQGTRKVLYNFLDDPPDLQHQPLPVVQGKYLRHFLSPNFGTIDAGRGCPFHCSFCTIINVQGRRMRCRDVETLLTGVRENYTQRGVSFYFFTDDNFARNRHWEEIFDGLIRMREEEKIPLEFMMQVDALSYRIPRFVEKARHAGCTQVFIGMESLNPENLKAAGKTQNDVKDLTNLVAAYHAQDIMTHAAYIIGFPFDTTESVRRDVAQLTRDLRVKQASFFMLTPLPGSQDHAEAFRHNVPMDIDFNQYDAFHPTTLHPRMSAAEWTSAYREAWRSFYSFENMRAILLETSAERYWNVFKNFLWARGALDIEHQHPMIAGLFRVKHRRSRRPGLPVEGRVAHMWARLGDMRRKSRAWFALFLEMEELWLQTRRRSVKEQIVVEEIRGIRDDVREWRDHTTKDLQAAYRRATARLKELPAQSYLRLRVPYRFSLFLKKWNILSDRIAYSRHSLDVFWTETRHNLLRGRLHKIRPHRIVVNLVRDVALTVQFALAMFASGVR